MTLKHALFAELESISCRFMTNTHKRYFMRQVVSFRKPNSQI